MVFVLISFDCNVLVYSIKPIRDQYNLFNFEVKVILKIISSIKTQLLKINSSLYWYGTHSNKEKLHYSLCIQKLKEKKIISMFTCIHNI